MSVRDVTRAANGQALVADLEDLVRETYLLWEPGWVNFNWRGYTYDHVQRVRGLAHTLCLREEGDCRVVELAALLHDITKAYDGDYVLDADGKRAVDERGYWRNAVRPPSAGNEVTRLYDRMGLAGHLHNESGAAVAYELLVARRVDERLAAAVAQTIADHLMPAADVPVESRCLYDADTIDANIGLPAFVRNIYIHLHYRDARRRPDEPDTDALLLDAPQEYLGPYVRERLPDWSSGKRRDFVPKLLTPSSVDLAERRLARLEDVWVRLAAEIDDWPAQCANGCLGVVLYLMRHRDEPSIDGEVTLLREAWLAAGSRTPEAARLVRDLDAEVHGVE
jgi:putative nucleotidyltransferase with HDIG domain